MTDASRTASAVDRGAGGAPAPRAPYTPPALDRLGGWSALTLQQSVPIGPGSLLPDPERTRRLG